MINPRKIEKLSQFLAMVFFILFAMCSGGCAGDRIEYDPPDSNWVGKVIHFKEPMAYIVFSNKGDAKEYGFDYAINSMER